MRRWLLFILLTLLTPAPVSAQWPAGGVLVGWRPLDLRNVFAFSDGDDGLIVTELDDVPGSPLHFQHVLFSGAYSAGLDSNGVQAIAPNRISLLADVVSDNRGGAWIAWVGCPAQGSCGTAALRLLHVDGAGVRVPGMDSAGVVVRPAAGVLNPRLVADSLGGVIVGWSGLSASNDYDVYALGFDALGVPRATPVAPSTGLPVSVTTGDQKLSAMCTDGDGGAFLVWSDGRAGGSARPYYTLRVDGTGAKAFASGFNGIRIATTSGGQKLMNVSPDGEQGFYFAWSEPEDYPYTPLYLQRISHGGSRFYNSSFGVPVSDSTGDCFAVRIVPAPNDEVFVVWSQGTLRMQRLGAFDGSSLWLEPLGRGFGPAAAITDVLAANDPGGGARVTFATFDGGQRDISTLQLDADAAPLAGQPADGVVLANGPGNETPLAMFATPGDAPLVVWQAGSLVVLASRLILPVAAAGPSATNRGFALRLLSSSPSPRGDALRIGFTLSAPGDARLELFDVGGRRMASRAIVAASVGGHSLSLDEARPLRPGVYLARLAQGGRVATLRWVRVN